MRVGVLVGRRADGGYEILGEPGSISELDALQRKVVDDGGVITKGKQKVKLDNTWLADVTRNPLKAKKCG